MESKGGKLFPASEKDGFIQSIRDTEHPKLSDQKDIAQIGGHSTGGYIPDVPHVNMFFGGLKPPFSGQPLIATPPGLDGCHFDKDGIPIADLLPELSDDIPELMDSPLQAHRSDPNTPLLPIPPSGYLRKPCIISTSLSLQRSFAP